MNKNVHFVQTNEYYNDEFRIYDIGYLSNNIIISTDLIGQLIYYEIPDNYSSIIKKETKEIYSTSDLDNLISLFSLDIYDDNNISPEILIGSSKGEIVNLKNNEISHKFTNNKSSEFSKVRFINENLFSGGDTKGNLTLFDIRQEKPIKIFSEQSEEITDILYDIGKPDYLLSSSIDSTLCVYDLRKHSLYALSDNLDEELNCLVTIKECNHILCGSGEGNILIFNWNWFGDFKDQIKGHPEGINSMDKYNDNIIFTGCEDGGIRICSMYPKGLRGILSSENNKKKSNFKDINKIKISKDKNSIITCSGMDCLRLYNISEIDFDKIYKPNNEFDLIDEKENSIENENINSDKDKDKEEENSNKKEKIKNKKKLIKEGSEEEEEEDNENGEDEDDEFDEEEEDDEDDIEDDEDDIEDDENDKEDNDNDKEDGDELEGSKDKGKKFINKKRKKEESEEENDRDSDNEDKNSSDSDSDDSSSSKKKRKTKKVKKLDKNKKTKSIIDKEERKAFFNDL